MEKIRFLVILKEYKRKYFNTFKREFRFFGDFDTFTFNTFYFLVIL